MLRAISRTIAVLAFALCASATAESLPTERESSPWHFGAGVSAGRLTPVMLEASAGYKAVNLHIGGFGFHKGQNDFWCGMRGTLAYTLFYTLPFSIELGASVGYEFAEAPNEIHRSVNKANEARLLYPYNYKELLDVSPALRINLFGFFSQVAFPVLRFKDHDAPDYNWRIGYIASF